MAFGEAKQLYEEWHQFEPEDILDIDIPEPEGELKYLGLLKRLDYMSDKWNQNEKVYYYHHFRKGWPRLYVDQKGNYFIYGYIRVTPDGIDDWLKPQIFEWKKPNVKKGVSKLGVLELLNWEDENGKTHTKMFGDRYYAGNPSKDFTYISTAMLENPRSKPVAVRQLEMIVRDIRKDKRAMKVLERALGNVPHRNPLPIPNQAIAAQAFLKSIVTGVSTATFGVGITATILGSLLVNFLLNTIKNRVSPPTMPPPPKWVMGMTKSYVAAGVKDPKDITDRIQEIWNQQTFESKVGIYEGETGKASEEDDEGEDVEEPDVGGAEATENPIKVEGGTHLGIKGLYGQRTFRDIHEMHSTIWRDYAKEGDTFSSYRRGNRFIYTIEKPDGTTRFEYCVVGEENPEKRQYSKEEIEQKALEMVFRWAYNRVIKEPGEAFSFFRRKGIDVAFSAVQHAFTMGKTRRHKDDAKKGKGGGDLPYIANPITSKSQWRLFKARYPQLFGDWLAHYPVKYGDLPERAEENAFQLSDSFVCENCRRRMPTRERHPQLPSLCHACGNWAIAEGYTATAENPLKYSDYKEAVEGEGWAIGDYAAMISEADTEQERKVLRHIRDEEKEHLDELVELMECKKAPQKSNPRTYPTNLRPLVRDELLKEIRAWCPPETKPESIADTELGVFDDHEIWEIWTEYNYRNKRFAEGQRPSASTISEVVNLWKKLKTASRGLTDAFAGYGEKIKRELRSNPVAKEWIMEMLASGEKFDRLSDYNQESRDYWLGKGTRFFKPAPPSGRIKIYRATVGDKIRLGDYVSNSLEYVKFHKETSMLGETKPIKILSMVVGLDELMPADAPNEFYLIPSKRQAKSNPTAWSSPDGRWRVEEWGPQDFTVVEILSTDPVAAALGEDARVWPARFKTVQGAIRKASKLAGVTYTANTVETILDPTRRDGR